MCWCRHCPTAYCQDHSDGISIHPELGALCGQHDEEYLEFLVQMIRNQGLDDNLPCPSPSEEQMAVWQRARGDRRENRMSIGSTTISGIEMAERKVERFQVGVFLLL